MDESMVHSITCAVHEAECACLAVNQWILSGSVNRTKLQLRKDAASDSTRETVLPHERGVSMAEGGARHRPTSPM